MLRYILFTPLVVALFFLLSVDFLPHSVALANTLFFDDFTDSDGTNLSTHNNSYYINQGTGTIQNNTLYSGLGSWLDFSLPTYVNMDQCASIDALFPFTAPLALQVRHSPVNGHYFFTYINDADDTFHIGWGDPYGASSIALNGVNVSSGWHNYKLCAIGDGISGNGAVRLTAYLDNSELYSYDEFNNNSGQGYGSGYPLVSVYDGYLDNFRFEQPTVSPVTITFTASGDTYVRSGQGNRNYGYIPFMRVQSTGDNRGLVRFDQSALQSSISGAVLSAKLRLTITDNGNNWGATGRTVDVYRIIADWAEGNGTENSNGAGSGATWNCAIDSIISNAAKNCSGATEWEMGQPNNPNVHPWVATATDSKTIINNQTGVVEYDVTADVQAFMNGTNNYGWLIKKTNEGQNGQVNFGTRESSSVPQLVVTYQP